MLPDAIGSLLPFAAGIALSPFPIIAIVLVLASPGGRSRGLAFSGGWLVGLGLLTAVIVLMFESADDSESGRTVVDVIRVALGVLLLWAAGRKWSSRPRDGEAAELPGWMASIDGLSVGGALRLGALLGGVNPKNIAFTMAAGSTIAELVDRGKNETTAAVVFVLLASLTVLGPVVLQLAAGERAAGTLNGVRRFMVQNAAVITMVVLAILGAKVLGDGLSGLSR